MPAGHALSLEFTHGLSPVLPVLLSRARALCDLAARPDLISKHVARDGRRARAVRRNPGLRVPGAFNGFETGVRAILGQQVTVKAATAMASRFAEAFGEPFATPFPELNRLTPAAGRVAGLPVDAIARLGVIAARARSVIALADAQSSRALCLDGAVRACPDDSIERIGELPGIGPWTAQYIAMRALQWPDAFPKEDVALRNRLGGITAAAAEELSQAWRPWRSYAVMHLWSMRSGVRAA
jgi:AraC family transcriptional regulator of adaptative response / DNA-3-methyladenine glycosylase II